MAHRYPKHGPPLTQTWPTVIPNWPTVAHVGSGALFRPFSLSLFSFQCRRASPAKTAGWVDHAPTRRSASRPMIPRGVVQGKFAKKLCGQPVAPSQLRLRLLRRRLATCPGRPPELNRAAALPRHPALPSSRRPLIRLALHPRVKTPRQCPLPQLSSDAASGGRGRAAVQAACRAAVQAACRAAVRAACRAPAVQAVCACARRTSSRGAIALAQLPQR